MITDEISEESDAFSRLFRFEKRRVFSGCFSHTSTSIFGLPRRIVLVVAIDTDVDGALLEFESLTS